MNVLVTPLDWGLGHATRCIPVINKLQEQGHKVIIAGSGPSLDLLKVEFPSNKFFEIVSYGINYSSRLPLLIHLSLRIPSVLRVIRREHEQVADIVKRENISAIISDNRYGCYHERIRSAIIIHQLNIQTPLNSVANHYNRKLISRFSECWVPDLPDHALSGKLSVSRIPHQFIGPLSRMKPRSSSARVGIVAIVSGPEPHRTAFDTLLTSELKAQPSYALVRGLPSSGRTDGPIYSHLPSQQLNDLIVAAAVVISRSGYSTIMDLAALNKKAIFVPTPGQTEQLYLAKELDRQKIAPMILQSEFSLQAALDRAKSYSGFTENYFKENLLERTLREFLD